MSGHSKWHNIKRRKEAVDAKKGAAFTKLSAEIGRAVRAAGADPAANAALRDVLARAKKADFPQANIDRLLGKGSAANFQAIAYEAFGPGGVGLIILAKTDNPNRTVSQLRTLLRDHASSLGTPNSVMWKFAHDIAQNKYTPKFSQPLDLSLKSQLDTLLTALKNHPDIEQIFTDAVQ